MSEGAQHGGRKIINWPEYNRALVNRGSLTFWFDEDIQSVWYHKLSLRSMEGFVNSLLRLIGLPLTCLHHTVFSKGRGKQLNIQIPLHLPSGPVDIMVDSTGLKVYGEGEWKVRKHGVGKRRTWRKLHLGVDPKTHDVVVAQSATVSLGDGEMPPDLLDQLDEDQALGDVCVDGS